MNSIEKYPLHRAVLSSDVKSVKLLVQSQVNLNDLGNMGHSALHWAVFRGNIEIADILLKAGANPNIFSTNDETPAWRAKDFGLTEIEVLLISFGAHK